jgi:hypothetical protein
MQLAEKFAAFEKSRDPALIHEALDIIEAAERDAPLGDATARRRVVSRWLRFFAALDRNIDPAWKPEDLPAKGVAPPVSHGIVYASGEVDPFTIADPVARAQYERALKDNKDQYQRYLVQLQLSRIVEHALRVVELFIAERFDDTPADRQEFEELLAASPVGDASKKQLRAFMLNRG